MNDEMRPPTSSNGPTAEQLERYFAGECGEVEAGEIRRYLAANQGVSQLFAGVARQLYARSSAVPPFAPEQGLTRLHKRLADAGDWPDVHVVNGVAGHTGVKARRAPRTMVPVSRGWGWRVPAAVLAAAALLVVAVGPRVWRTWTAQSSPVMTYSTTNGQRATVGLGDGSSVVLAANSRLSYSTNANGIRTAVLDGQAYFDVSHAATRPFVVQTKRSYTRVLGTQFSVSAYPEDSVVTIAVESGRVMIRGANSQSLSTTLERGQLGAIGSNRSPTVSPISDLSTYTGWTSGTLTFRGASLGEIAHVLERWYDVDIRFSDAKLTSLTLAVAITQQPVDDAMKLLASTAGLQYTRQGRVVTLSQSSLH